METNLLNFIHTNLYGEITSQEIINFYSQNNDCDYYVFKRKMHNGNNYHAYLKANGQSASEDTLSQPAFPTYLLPPESVIQEIEKSPKLRLELEGFRKNNWEDIIGSYVGNVDEICSKTKKNKASAQTKVINMLNGLRQGASLTKKTDEYIYSLYLIQKKSETDFYCCHMADITQKPNGAYSQKSPLYFKNLPPYTVKIENNTIQSEFGSIISVTNFYISPI